MKIEIKKLANSEVELAGEIAVEHFEAKRGAAVKRLNSEVKVAGFRPGNIPEPVLISKLGEERILLEMAELALTAVYPEILKQEKIDALGQPNITITKLAKDNPLGFSIRTAVRPEFSLPDYEKLAKQIEPEQPENLTVTEKEIEEVVAEIKKQKPEPEIKPEQREIIKHNLLEEKKRRARDKQRLQIIDKILEKTEIILPKVLIETELDKMLAEMKQQLEQMGLKMTDYLKHIKKEEKDLRAEWRNEAEKRLKTGLIISEIAKQEKLELKSEEVEREVKHLQEHYRDAPAENLRRYVSEMLMIEKVWELLANGK